MQKNANLLAIASISKEKDRQRRKSRPSDKAPLCLSLVDVVAGMVNEEAMLDVRIENLVANADGDGIGAMGPRNEGADAALRQPQDFGAARDRRIAISQVSVLDFRLIIILQHMDWSVTLSRDGNTARKPYIGGGSF